MAIDFQSAWK